MTKSIAHARFMLVLLATTWAGLQEGFACDELASRLIANRVRPAIEGMGCGVLEDAGLDRSEHRLDGLCYTSTGATSELALTFGLSCRTGDNAFLKAEVSEEATASATVRGSDCLITDLTIQAAGEIGSILVQAFDVSGKAREELQKALNEVCR